MQSRYFCLDWEPLAIRGNKARVFSGVGKFSHYIDIAYYPVSGNLNKNTLAMVLSASGETEDRWRLASQFSLQYCKHISVTGSENSTLVKKGRC